MSARAWVTWVGYALILLTFALALPRTFSGLFLFAFFALLFLPKPS
jgi:hypothetical protein